MKRSVTPHRLLALAIALSVGSAQAATVIIEPDDYTGDVSNVAPGATLSTYRWDGGTSYEFRPALSVVGGRWNPTGKRVFGHHTQSPLETEHHWDNLTDAAWCDLGNPCFPKFYVFRADFDMPTTTVSVLSTIRGEQALNPLELSAFDANGHRILRCRAFGMDNNILASGVYPAPRYYNPLSLRPLGAACGTVLVKKNCATWPGAEPGDCDYVISLRVERKQSDIAYVMFAGLDHQGSWAPLDKLSYNYIPTP